MLIWTHNGWGWKRGGERRATMISEETFKSYLRGPALLRHFQLCLLGLGMQPIVRVKFIWEETPQEEGSRSQPVKEWATSLKSNTRWLGSEFRWAKQDHLRWEDYKAAGWTALRFTTDWLEKVTLLVWSPSAEASSRCCSLQRQRFGMGGE